MAITSLKQIDGPHEPPEEGWKEGPLGGEGHAFLGSWEGRSRGQEVEGRKAARTRRLARLREDRVNKGGVSRVSEGWDGRAWVQNL